jgi:hypothetical protein
MLTKYTQAALRHASYEILSDDKSFYGEIPVCNGVYANATTLEDCRQRQSVTSSRGYARVALAA